MAADYTDEELERAHQALSEQCRLKAGGECVKYARAVLDAVVPSIVERLHGEYEQVGTQDRDGYLHELRQQWDGEPVFVRRSIGETT